MEEVLPSELWPEIVKHCSPLTLFFLERVSCQLRMCVADLFSVIKVECGAPEVSSCEELLYYFSLKTEEKVKYCIERGWLQTLNLIECGGKQRAPLQYKVLYPEMMKRSEYLYGDSYKALNEAERALLFVRLTYERYNTFSGYIREKTKIPLPVMRKRIEKQESTSDEIAVYWVFTGEDLGRYVNRSKWQICRDFVASGGTTTPPPLGHPFYELVPFHGDARLIVKCCSFTCPSTVTEVILARRVLTRDQFFSLMKGRGWDHYFSSRGMESSYLRYAEGKQNRQSSFLQSNNLSAVLRNTQREEWPEKLSKNSEFYRFCLGRQICK